LPDNGHPGGCPSPPGTGTQRRPQHRCLTSPSGGYRRRAPPTGTRALCRNQSPAAPEKQSACPNSPPFAAASNQLLILTLLQPKLPTHDHASRPGPATPKPSRRRFCSGGRNSGRESEIGGEPQHCLRRFDVRDSFRDESRPPNHLSPLESCQLLATGCVATVATALHYPQAIREDARCLLGLFVSDVTV